MAAVEKVTVAWPKQGKPRLQLAAYVKSMFRCTGSSKFEIPELLNDFDFPNQYMRRIRSVPLSIPCIVGPYTGINYTLKLSSSSFRTKVFRRNEIVEVLASILAPIT
jgi:hypothetical protein